MSDQNWDSVSVGVGNPSAWDAVSTAAQHDQMTHHEGFNAGVSAELYGGPKGKTLYGPITMEPAYDYFSGVPDAGVRWNLSRADNKDEQQAALEKKFGKGNAFQDRYGNWIIKPEGFERAGLMKPMKPTAVLPHSGDRRSIFDYGGSAVPLAGGLTGAALAPVTGGASAAIGYGIAGAAGAKSLDELTKAIQGFYRKSFVEGINAPAKEGLQYGIGEGIGRGALGLKNIISTGPSRFVSEAGKEAFKDAQAHGYTPTISQAIPGLRITAREQQMGHRVFSDPALKKNVEALAKEISGFLKRTGVPEEKLDETLGKISAAATGDEEFGKVIVQSAKRARQAMELEATKSREQAGLELSKKLGQLQRQISIKGSDTNAVRESIVHFYDEFREKAAAEYGKLDQIAGKPIIPTQPLKDAAAQIKQSRARAGGVVSDSEVDGLIRRIEQMPDYLSAQGMQQIRSRFGEKWFPQNMVKGLDDAERAQLYAGTEDSFGMAIHMEGGSQEGAILEGLKATDKWYKGEIEKFRNVQVAALVKEAGERGAVDPGQVVEYLIKPGKSEQLGRVMRLLTPEAKQNLAGAHFKSMIRSVTNQEGEVSSKALKSRITDLGPMLEQVYGKTDAALIRKYSDMLAAYNGHLDPRELGGGSFPQILENAVRKEKAAADFMKDNYLSELSKGGAEATKAVDYIVQPNHPERVRAAIKFFGEDSKEVEAMRQQVLQKMFQEMYLQTEVGGAKTMAEYVSGANLQKVMKSYGQPTLEAVFGKEMFADLTKFASRAEYVTRRGGQAGELVSASVALRPLRHKMKLAEIYALSHVMSRPGFMKYMVLGASEPESAAGKAANRIVNEALLNAGRASPYGIIPPFNVPNAEPSAKDKFMGTLQP